MRDCGQFLVNICEHKVLVIPVSHSLILKEFGQSDVGIIVLYCTTVIEALDFTRLYSGGVRSSRPSTKERISG